MGWGAFFLHVNSSSSWISSWKDYPIFIGLSLYLCWKLTTNMCVCGGGGCGGGCFESLFCFILFTYLSVFSLITCCAYCCSFIVSPKVVWVLQLYSLFFFSKIILAMLVPLYLHISLLILQKKNLSGILTKTALCL